MVKGSRYNSIYASAMSLTAYGLDGLFIGNHVLPQGAKWIVDSLCMSLLGLQAPRNSNSRLEYDISNGGFSHY